MAPNQAQKLNIFSYRFSCHQLFIVFSRWMQNILQKLESAQKWSEELERGSATDVNDYLCKQNVVDYLQTPSTRIDRLVCQWQCWESFASRVYAANTWSSQNHIFSLKSSYLNFSFGTLLMVSPRKTHTHILPHKYKFFGWTRQIRGSTVY